MKKKRDNEFPERYSAAPVSLRLSNAVFDEYWGEVDENQDWGIPDGVVQEDQVVSFSQAVNLPWCTQYKTEERLLKFLKRVGYPKRLIEQKKLTQTGYAKALECARDLRRRADADRKREKRKSPH
jgi:hypothetical protein